MIITIGKPCAITEKGGRSNNEDSIYPLPEQVTLDQKLFMVCDGVGGAEKGEVASSLACESIQTFFSTFLKDDPRLSLSIKPYIMRKSVSTPMFKSIRKRWVWLLRSPWPISLLPESYWLISEIAGSII